jgi:hypothetical protein
MQLMFWTKQKFLQDNLPAYYLMGLQENLEGTKKDKTCKTRGYLGLTFYAFVKV